MRKRVLAVAAATVVTVGVVGGVATAYADESAKGDCSTKIMERTTKAGVPVHASASGDSKLFGYTKYATYTFDHDCVNEYGHHWFQFKGAGDLNNGWIYSKYVS